MKRVLIIKNGTCSFEKSLSKILCDVDKDIHHDAIITINTIDLINTKTAESCANEYNYIIICGGQQTLTNRKSPQYIHPHLNTLIEYVRIWIKLNVKVLGICLGAQIIGEACDNKIQRLSKPIIGFDKFDKHNHTFRFEHNKQNLLSDWFESYIPFVLSCHADYVHILKESNVIVELIMRMHNCDIPYAFRSNNAYGIQFHFEINDILFDEVTELCYQLKDESEFYKTCRNAIHKTAREFLKRWLTFYPNQDN